MELSFDTVAVPVASEGDADATCAAVRPYVSPDTSVVVVHVIEKAGGGIDPTPVEQQQRRARRIFDRCIEQLSRSAETVTTEMRYHTDVVDGIIDAAAEGDADAIVFTPREASRLSKFVSGDVAFKLVHRTDRPLVVVPPVPDGST